MATGVKDLLCRLCAKRDDCNMKDLADESNKNVSKLIKEFLQIKVNLEDNLPTKICLDCEEKIVSFQLFVIECQGVQEILKNICCVSHTNEIPTEVVIEKEYVDIELDEIKAEVKHELTPEDLPGAINNGSLWTELDTAFQDNSDNEDSNEEENYSYLDYVPIASLKGNNSATTEPTKSITPEIKAQLDEILKKPRLVIKNLVRMDCTMCDFKTKTWKNLSCHSTKMHKTKNPFVYCLCGFPINSRSVLFDHFAEHEAEHKKLTRGKKNIPHEEEAVVKKSKKSSRLKFIRYICKYCKLELSSWYTLRKHIERAHKAPVSVQCRCGFTLKSKSSLYKHISDHQNPEMFRCEKCPKIVNSLEKLEKHKLRHVPKSERKFCCSSCDKIFTTKDALKSHLRSHIPLEQRRIYHCSICHLKFTSHSSMICHKRVVHDKIKSFICDLCGYACGTNGELRQHRAIHSEDKPYTCEKCSKTFKTYSNLKTHLDTHGDTSYVCYICNRTLNSRRTLRKHLLVHQEICTHTCSYCNKSFKRRQTLKVHMYTHTGDKPLTCKWCNERFSYASTLRSHRLRCHPDKVGQKPPPPADKMTSYGDDAYNTYEHGGQDYQKHNIKIDKIEVDNDAIL